MIIRVQRHDRDFTIIGNAALRDSGLTFTARGILAYLLSLPPDTRVDATELEAGTPLPDERQRRPEGRKSILAALKELERRGYLHRRRFRDDAGRWRSESDLYEQPKPVTEVPVTTVVTPTVGVAHSKEKDSEKDSLASATPIAKERPKDPLAGALAAACFIDFKNLTTSSRGAFNRALKELRDVQATPEQIRARAKAYRTKYPQATLTPSALAKHWPQLLTESERRQLEPAEPHRHQWQQVRGDDRGDYCACGTWSERVP